jgi:hypothetical protein
MSAPVFRFSNLYSERGVASELWQAELWLQAHFSVEVAEGILLSEPYWCVVELALSLAAWLPAATENGPAYSYKSMEAEEELLRFSPVAPGKWVIGSDWTTVENSTPCSFAALQGACRRYFEQAVSEARRHMSEELAGDIARRCA